MCVRDCAYVCVCVCVCMCAMQKITTIFVVPPTMLNTLNNGTKRLVTFTLVLQASDKMSKKRYLIIFTQPLRSGRI